MRLIDADALIEQMEADAEHLEESLFKMATYAAINDVKHQPTIEPERKKGRWIDVTNGRGGHECDQCHNYAPAWQTGKERLTDFCPNCGAKMEE